MRDSPAIQFLTVLWENSQKATGHSWLRLNQSMRSGLMLAVEAGLTFDVGDLSVCGKRFDAGYWFGENIEDFYGRAACYGNSSAWKCYEEWTGRKPFIVSGAKVTVHYGGGRMGESLARLVEGAEFNWKGERVTVTSFNDKLGSLTACSYVRSAPDICSQCKHITKYDRPKILHRYAITHAMLSAEKKRIKEAKHA